MAKIRQQVGAERFAQGHYQRARELFEELTLAPELGDFLTIPAAAHLQ